MTETDKDDGVEEQQAEVEEAEESVEQESEENKSILRQIKDAFGL